MKFMKKGEEKILVDKVDKHYSSAGPHNTSFMCRHYYGAYFVCLFILGAVAISLLTSDNTFAAASTISLNVSSDVISVDVASLTTTGTFAKSNNVTITASTNNATGYELKVAAANSSDPSHLINTSDSSAKLSSITSATTEAQFSALTGTAYNGKWGYLPSKYDSTANTDFLPAPDTTGDVINKTECANGTSPCPAQDTYTMAIGARVDSTTRIGAYENTYVILATANAIPYTIIYDDNVIGNMPVDVNSTSVSTSIPISSNTPTRDGYTFLGWCTAPTPVVTDPSSIMSTCASAGGIMYQPGSSWTISQTGTNNLHLYAMWGGNPLAMQAWSSEQCDSMQVDDVITLTDTRDNQKYRISKLADDNCWMLDNLRLDPTTVSLSMLKGRTNASDQTLTYFKEGGGSSPYTNVGVNTTWASSSDNKYDEPKVVTTYKDTTTTNYGAGSGKIGVYYNFCAASAGSYCYPSSSSTGDATEDLCPAGWRMPTGGSSGEYQALYTAYSSDATNFRNALSTPLSGTFFSGSAGGQGGYGSFWSSTRSSNDGMRGLFVGDSSVGPASGGIRYSGYSVRCVLK